MWQRLPAPVVTAVAAFAVLLPIILPGAEGIMCYQCNSKTEPGCAEIAAPPFNGSARYYKECDENGDGKPPFCRKSIIKVLKGGGGGASDERVVRTCGWMRHSSDCYQYDDDDHHELVCQCFSDGCNAGVRAAPAAALAAALFAALPLLH